MLESFHILNTMQLIVNVAGEVLPKHNLCIATGIILENPNIETWPSFSSQTRAIIENLDI